ncbi:hypothetical protein K432DRAFT_403665 [Lepidopterella palustris CBS 459.81]|uniref:N-acetyltransferase domain-containing protein n=1 Tax=Lepidopterella palustris CBS 459.81 TaxID=1314670 RepID=A0A8E2JGD5_9PEZI|nr:hypothetical protein K432DRAFT_403665 [Lepidopterella palustris CBS 459.81]
MIPALIPGCAGATVPTWSWPAHLGPAEGSEQPSHQAAIIPAFKNPGNGADSLQSQNNIEDGLHLPRRDAPVIGTPCQQISRPAGVVNGEGEIDQNSQRPRGRKSKRKQWKKVAIERYYQAGTSQPGNLVGQFYHLVHSELGAGEKEKGPVTWGEASDEKPPDLTPNQVASTTSPPIGHSNPTHCHPQVVKSPAGAHSQALRAKSRGRNGRQACKPDDMATPSIPPHRRTWANRDANSAPAVDNTGEATAIQLQDAFKGGLQQLNQVARGPHGGGAPRSRRIIKQVFPASALHLPSENAQNGAARNHTSAKAVRQNDKPQEASTASTQQATGTNVPNSHNTPPSSPPHADDHGVPNTKKADFEKSNKPPSQAPKLHQAPVARGRQPPQNRWKPWPKNKDLKAPPKGSTDSEDDGGASIKSDSNGDPTYDIKKLTDWDGNWLPAPVEWEGRRGFSDRNFFNRIEDWITKSEKFTTAATMDVKDPAFCANRNGEMAPRFWIPTTMDAESPQSFWRTYQNCSPAPLSDVDVAEKPWWETYPSASSNLLPPVTVPDAQLDSQEVTYGNAVKDMGSIGAIRKREAVMKEKERRAAEKRRYQEEENRQRAAFDEPIVAVDVSIHPEVNIFLRPVYPADLQQITDLYNHYVRNTINSPECKPCTRQSLISRLTDIVEHNNLPYIVAIDKSKGFGTSQSYLKHLPDKIVGFAHADDYHSSGSMYRFTVELEMFVHPNYCNKGIGSCLMDKMLDIMDIGYQPRGGYDWVKNDTFQAKGARIVKSVNFTVPYDARDETEITWNAKFLRSFGFKKAGNLHRVGFKLEKMLDLAIFQYITSEDIDIKMGPMNAL